MSKVKVKQKVSSTHTWIGTIGSLISIVAWLTGLQTIYDIKSLKIGQVTFLSWTIIPLSVSISLFLISNTFIWVVYYFISASVVTKTQNNVLIKAPAKLAVWVLSFSIGITLLDSFFNLRNLLNTVGDFDSYFILVSSGIVMVLALPITTVSKAINLAEERGCGVCGKLSLVDDSSQNTDVSEEKNYIIEDEVRLLRVYKYQNYELNRECKSCGTNWTFYKKYLLDTKDAPEKS